MQGALILLVFAATTAAAAPRHARRAPTAPGASTKPQDAKDDAKADKPDAKADKPDAKPDGRAAKDAKPDGSAAKDGKADKADKPDAKAAKPETAAPPRTPGPKDAKAAELLARIVAAPDAAARKAAIGELTAIAPTAIDALGDWLARTGRAEVAERRAVLTAIKASVPDKTGKFSQPPRQTGKERQADDEVDWLAELLVLEPAPPGAGDVIADVAALRALAATADPHAAQLIFDTAFAADTMIYRDECGRYLRKLEPASIPALTLESLGKDADRKRYATWQLERLDRQEPGKALDAALGDEALTIQILDVFRRTHHREAVHAVWRRINADSPRVRDAARAAWMDYITGPPPPPAPVARLNLPGGKKTKRAKPLWLTYRELADNELRKAANELLHEDYPLDDPTLDDTDHARKTVAVDLEELTRRLFAYYDGERTKQEAAQWGTAKRAWDAGDLATASKLVDRMLATNPARGERGERAEMAKLYLAWGKQLEAKPSWADAAAAYSKAHGLDPGGPAATDALAAYHVALGKALEAEGKDGGPEFRRAVALRPDNAPARTAAQAAASADRPVWMLYAAAGAALAAMLLFALAMLMRRRA